MDTAQPTKSQTPSDPLFPPVAPPVEKKSAPVAFRMLLISLVTFSFIGLILAIFVSRDSSSHHLYAIETVSQETVDPLHTTNIASPAQTYDEFFLIVGGTIVRDGAEYWFEPDFIPRLSTDSESSMADNEITVASNFRLDLITSNGVETSVDLRVDICPEGADYCEGVEVLPDGERGIVSPERVFMAPDIVRIEFYAGETLLYSMSRSVVAPSIASFTKSEIKKDGSPSLWQYDWKVVTGKGRQISTLFEYLVVSNDWRAHVFGAYPHINQATIDPSVVSFEREHADVRLTITDGFYAVTMSEENSFSNPN